MFLTENNIDAQKINRLIGAPIDVNIHNLRRIGSPGLFLKSFINKKNTTETIKINSKCNFEKRPAGIYYTQIFPINEHWVPFPKKRLSKFYW